MGSWDDISETTYRKKKKVVGFSVTAQFHGINSRKFRSCKQTACSILKVTEFKEGNNSGKLLEIRFFLIKSPLCCEFNGWYSSLTTFFLICPYNSNSRALAYENELCNRESKWNELPGLGFGHLLKNTLYVMSLVRRTLQYFTDSLQHLRNYWEDSAIVFCIL